MKVAGAVDSKNAERKRNMSGLVTQWDKKEE